MECWNPGAVGLRDELAVDHPQQADAGQHPQHAGEDRPGRAGEERVQQAAVAAHQGVDRAAERGAHAALGAAVAQDAGAEHRRQGQRDEA